MTVFTPQWIKDLRSRYETLPNHQRPLAYFVATHAEFPPIREEIQQWVQDLPPHSQKILIPRLRRSKSFWQTYHELVVGGLLKERGLRIEYERDIDGKTPDWYVSTSDGAQSLIVEVFTQNISGGEDSFNERLADLQWRLQKISVDVGLGISFKGKAGTFDSHTNKLIAGKLKEWIEGNHSSIGSKLNVHGLEFEVISRDRGFSGVQWLGFSRCGWVSPIRLRKNIEEKVKQYKEMALRNGLPLVVGVVADFRTGYDVEEFENVLMGQLVADVAVDRTTGRSSIASVRRQQNSLFAARPKLSGAVWAWRSTAGKWVMKGYLNPHAHLPLCSTSFTRKQLWVANGCASWLSMRRTTRLWSPLT